MNSHSIIKQALEYYDKISESKFDKINKIKSASKIFEGSDVKYPIMDFFDKDKKKLFTAEYEIIGTEYNLDDNTIWIWSWANPQLSKNNTYMSRSLLKYGLDIDSTLDQSDILVKSILTNSRIKINNILESNIIIALSIYIAKNEGVIELDVIEYGINFKHWILIKKIIQ